MSRLILVEDMPWRTKNNLKELIKNNVLIEKVLYFTGNENLTADPRMEDFIEDIGANLVEIVNLINFNSTMNRYYKEEDVVFLIDCNLEESDPEFEKKISVKYAMGRPDKGKGKIWFYTTGGTDMKSKLRAYFENQIVDVINFYDNQLQWDNDKILQITKD